jgi:hypothetical protein
MPVYTEIDWEKAACKGFYTELFYKVEEETKLLKKVVTIDFFRNLCLACPLWKDCLNYGSKYEKYGVWGGMTTAERDSFLNNSNNSLRVKVIKSFDLFGITEEMIREVLEI